MERGGGVRRGQGCRERGEGGQTPPIPGGRGAQGGWFAKSILKPGSWRGCVRYL